MLAIAKKPSCKNCPDRDGCRQRNYARGRLSEIGPVYGIIERYTKTGHDLCEPIWKLINSDTAWEYRGLISRKPEPKDVVGGGVNNSPNLTSDNLALYHQVFEGLIDSMVEGGFEDPEVAELYKSHMQTALSYVRRKRQETPAYAFIPPKEIVVLRLYFTSPRPKPWGIREIARKLDMGHSRVSTIIKKYKPVLLKHFLKVFRSNLRKEYFYLYYFERKNINQIADMFDISKQAVSKSIARTSKRVVKELRKTVDSSHIVKGGFSKKKTDHSKKSKPKIIFFDQTKFRLKEGKHGEREHETNKS